MRRWTLRRRLLAAIVGLVLAAVVCVDLAAIARLERLADEQALARAQLAGSGALRDIQRAGEELRVHGRVLAERPTLAQLLRARDIGALVPFLEQFRRTSRLTGCAILADGGVVAAAGALFTPEDVARGGRLPEGAASLVRSPNGGLGLGGVADVPTVPGARVLVTRAIDPDFERALSRRTGLPVRILDREAVVARAGDAPADLRLDVLDEDRPVVARLDAAEAYLAILPLHGTDGRPLGIVETTLDRRPVAASLRDLRRSLAGIAAGVTIAATLLSLLLARGIARPVEALTRSAERIGAGDLVTPVPRTPGLEIGGLAVTMEEMRDRLRRLTVELAGRQAEAEGILGGIREGVFAVDRDRRIRYLNPQAATLLGVGIGEALGRFCGDVLRPQGRDGVRPCEDRCPIIDARSSGRAQATETLLLPGSRTRTVVITSAAGDAGEASLPAAPDAGARQIQVMRDETDTEATRRLRDAVLANISHEFRTPLAAQLASIELLRDQLRALDAVAAEPLVLSLERGTLRLTQLIDNLLESVRIEAGLSSVRRREVALDDVVEQAVQMTDPLIAQRGQAIVVALPHPLPAVLGDGPRLTQALVNLLANAQKFAPADSTIRIGGEVGAAEVTLWVEDEGPGLPAGPASPLFEPFVRARETDGDEEPEQSGMGLGLWIVKSIVERHGGRVEVRRGAATGMRVCIILPWRDAHEDSGG